MDNILWPDEKTPRFFEISQPPITFYMPTGTPSDQSQPLTQLKICKLLDKYEAFNVKKKNNP